MGGAPLDSAHGLREAFAGGLARMLENHDSLGVYILVLANALQDPALWVRLGPALAERHARLGEDLVRGLRHGSPGSEPEDDLMVFLKLLAIGFEHLAPVELRRVESADPAAGPAWELQFNPVRALRPARMSQTRTEGMLAPFDPRGFHFNKPFLRREVLWEGELNDKPARLLYNKFPFAPLHGLLVPEPDRQRPQFLTPELHGWAWTVAGDAAAAIPGFGLAYNSYGAFASVNHLHFQTFVRPGPLPAQTDPEGPYPLARRFFGDPEAAWFHLDELHGRGQAYNLVYGGDGLLVMERVRQGEQPNEPWSAGFAWSEVAGVFPVAGRAPFESLDHAGLARALLKLKTPAEP